MTPASVPWSHPVPANPIKSATRLVARAQSVLLCFRTALKHLKVGGDKEASEQEGEVHPEFELSCDVTVDDGCAAVNFRGDILKRPRLPPF